MRWRRRVYEVKNLLIVTHIKDEGTAFSRLYIPPWAKRNGSNSLDWRMEPNRDGMVSRPEQDENVPCGLQRNQGESFIRIQRCTDVWLSRLEVYVYGGWKRS
jgi:hypothetical protein